MALPQSFMRSRLPQSMAVRSRQTSLPDDLAFPQPTWRRVLQAMASKGIIVSTRGSGGGFSLKKPASELSCLEAIEALEGPLPSRYCLLNMPFARKDVRLQGTLY
jgi:DNA-binding IscR family transcriptional regulator